eukprot:COSAG01_NODE_580_length_15231_cov_6.793220_6_plen_222_part_00
MSGRMETPWRGPSSIEVSGVYVAPPKQDPTHASDVVGIVSFCNELWNAMEHVLSQCDPPQQYDHSTDLGTGTVKAGMVGTREEDWAALYAWIDAELPKGGSGPFSAEGGGPYLDDWTPFEHPQLGAVEIGGLNTKWILQNPPPGPLLVREQERNTAFSMALAGALPAVKVVSASATPLLLPGNTEDGAAADTTTTGGERLRGVTRWASLRSLGGLILTLGG